VQSSIFELAHQGDEGPDAQQPAVLPRQARMRLRLVQFGLGGPGLLDIGHQAVALVPARADQDHVGPGWEAREAEPGGSKGRGRADSSTGETCLGLPINDCDRPRLRPCLPSPITCGATGPRGPPCRPCPRRRARPLVVAPI